MVGIIQRSTCIQDVVQLLTKLAIREKRMLVLVNQRSWEDMGSEVKGPRRHVARDNWKWQQPTLADGVERV